MKNKIFRKVTGIYTLIILIITMVLPVYSKTSLKVRINVNGEVISSDVDPVIKDGRTLVPARAIFEKLGAKVSWDDSSKEIKIEYNSIQTLLKINKKTAQVNGKDIQLDVPPLIINDRAMIPVRFVSENFGFFVEWNEAEKLVSIDSLNKGFINSIDVSKSSEYDVVSIKAGAYKNKSISYPSPKEIVIDLANTKVFPSAKTESTTINDSNFVTGFKCFQYNKDTARIIIETNQENVVRVDEKNNELLLYIENVIGNMKYSENSDLGIVDLENIWLYQGTSNDSAKLYTIQKEPDNKKITLSFDQSLLRKLANKTVITNGSIIDQYSIVNDETTKQTKIIMTATKDVDISDTSFANSSNEFKNSQFSIKPITNNEPPKNNTSEYLTASFNEENGKSYVRISGKDLTNYNIFRLTNSDRIVIDITNGKVEKSSGEYPVNNENISKIRYSQFSSTQARFVIDTLKQVDYIAEIKDGDLIIEILPTSYKNIYYENSDTRKIIIGNINLSNTSDYQKNYDANNKYFTLSFPKTFGSYGTGSLKINDGKVDYIKVEETETTNNVSIKVNSDYDFNIVSDASKNQTYIELKPLINFSSKIVVIDPGHGGSESGATSKGILEKDLNLAISKKVAQILSDKGIKIIMTRSDDSTVGLYDRADVANKANATFFVSIHNNSYTESSKGTETLYNENKGDYGIGFTGKNFATIVQKNLVSKIGLTNRGIVNRPNLAVLNSSNVPAILTEVGFMSNPTELEKLVQDSFQQKAAEGICDGIIEALGQI